MDLETLTSGRYIRVGLQASRKETAIEQLLDCLINEEAIPEACRDEVLETIMIRERRLSTGLEAGVAIPHGTTVRVTREVAALGVYPEGVPFETVDDRIPQIVILLITPVSRRTQHVINLATIARQLSRDDIREALIAATSREEALAAIRRLPPEDLQTEEVEE